MTPASNDRPGDRPAPPLVLIIDDDVEYASGLAAILSPNFACRIATGGEEGLGAIAADAPDAVILDLCLGDGRSGLEFLNDIHRSDPALPVIMVTNYPSAESEAETLRRGALYYLRKAAGRGEILSKLEKCAEVGGAQRQRNQLSQELKAVHRFFRTSSPVMRALHERCDRIAAAVNTTVLITGESGTGKSLLAREIHRRSPRSAGTFLHVNMATLRGDTASSELFGHVRGAFTGAVSDRKGHFETARGGTLFLDEISRASPEVQAGLLSALEESEILPVGSSTPRRVQARLMAATNRDLAALVREGSFGADLLGRLSVVVLECPPLRDHPEDVDDLARYFVGRISAEMGLGPVAISEEAMETLQRYAWKRNNVRELKNTIERALVLHGGAWDPKGSSETGSGSVVLEPEAFDLPQEEPACSAPVDGNSGMLDYTTAKTAVIERFQRQYFEQAFRIVGGSIRYPRGRDISRVADKAGLPARTVRRILEGLEGSRAVPPVDSDLDSSGEDDGGGELRL